MTWRFLRALLVGLVVVAGAVLTPAPAGAAAPTRIMTLGDSITGSLRGQENYDVKYLDMVNNFNPSSRTSWGERFPNGPNGIRQTSTEATGYAQG